MKKSTHNFCFADVSRQTFGKILPSVELRSKTVKAFEGNDEEFLNAVIKSCYEFSQKSFKDARQFLWKMKFNREEALNCLGFTMYPDKEALLLLNELQAEKIYNELRFQYSKTHDGFLKVENKDWCKDELTALKKAVNCDPVVFFTIVSVCEQSYGKNRPFLVRCINDLRSNHSRIQFMALRYLGFSSESASILLPYCQEISNLLQASMEYYNNQKLLTACEDKDNLEVKKVSQDSEVKNDSTNNTQDKEVDSVMHKVSLEPSSDTSTINVDVLLKNKERVQAFIKLYQDLHSAGIDGMKILNKIDVIESLYEAVNNLST